jgi:hypothetical protein
MIGMARCGSVALIVLALAACGGGGGSSGSVTPAQSAAPTPAPTSQSSSPTPSAPTLPPTTKTIAHAQAQAAFASVQWVASVASLSALSGPAPAANVAASGTRAPIASAAIVLAPLHRLLRAVRVHALQERRTLATAGCVNGVVDNSTTSGFDITVNYAMYADAACTTLLETVTGSWPNALNDPVSSTLPVISSFDLSVSYYRNGSPYRFQELSGVINANAGDTVENDTLDVKTALSVVQGASPPVISEMRANCDVTQTWATTTGGGVTYPGSQQEQCQIGDIVNDTYASQTFGSIFSLSGGTTTASDLSYSGEGSGTVVLYQGGYGSFNWGGGVVIATGVPSTGTNQAKLTTSGDASGASTFSLTCTDSAHNLATTVTQDLTSTVSSITGTITNTLNSAPAATFVMDDTGTGSVTWSDGTISPIDDFSIDG